MGADSSYYLNGKRKLKINKQAPSIAGPEKRGEKSKKERC
jgi:hypothetical protein